jgi:putative membrane-bound dehydrogenase-like protein
MKITIQPDTLLLWILIPFCVLFAGCSDRTSSEKIADADIALSSFEIEEGFKIELLASEPLIGDPVDIEVDEYGRLYVVEMPGYPLDISGSGKIKLLADTNGDGRMDKSTLFAEDLVLPNSVMRWKNGVLVTDAPHVLYFEDADGDGRAEIRDTLLSGFARSNPQHNLNSPLLAIDNWIYLAHEGVVTTETYEKEFGDRGSEIFFPGLGNSPRLGTNANGRAVRFDPDAHKIEEVSSETQFGHTFDKWGHHFLVGNANHIFHEVVAEIYLKRNRDLPVSNATQSLSDHGNAAEVFPVTEDPEHQLLTDVGVITSACGLTAYLGGAFPSPYNENVTFVAEPVSNLIHADRLKEDGATFVASRVKPHQEFLASHDAKFRPVNLYTGPDGALYVVDYYRQIIEHPEWMGEEVIKSGALYNDADKGRIYRISAKDAAPAAWTKGLNLGDATDAALVENLANPNVWWRMNAQRLLVDRRSENSVKPLIAMLANPDAMGRLHAMWVLEGIGRLKDEQILKALRDPVAGIRENAVKLAEAHSDGGKKWQEPLIAMKSDPDPKVRFQLLCALGSFDTDAAREARYDLLFGDIDDPWFQVAALTVSAKQNEALMDRLNEKQIQNNAYPGLIKRLAAVISSRENALTIKKYIEIATSTEDKDHSFRSALLDGLAEGLRNRNSPTHLSAKEVDRLMQSFFNDPPDVRKAALNFLRMIKQVPGTNPYFQKAMQLASDKNVDGDKRADAIDLLAASDPLPYREYLASLLTPHEPLNIQLAALRSLSAIADTTVSRLIVDKWTALTPEIRDAAIGTFLKDQHRVDKLLDAIEQGIIPPSAVTWPRQVHLMAQSNETLRGRSRKIFAPASDAAATPGFQQLFSLKGDASKGKEIFRNNCSICHQVRGEMGLPIGPDLGTIHNWSKEAILANTMDPNLSISSGFDLWLVTLVNGESIQGIIASETPGALTLRNNGARDRTISRRDIQTLKAMNMSIMPAMNEKIISQQGMADLLAFLKQNK